MDETRARRELAEAPLLKEIPLFSKLDEGELAHVAARVEWSDLTDGSEIFKEGSPGDSLFIVEKGEVVVSKVIDHDAGTEKTLAVVGRGAFFGEMSLLDNEPRSATVRAHGPVRLLILDRSLWQELLRESATLASKLLFGILQTTTTRLRRTSRDLVTLYDTGKLVGTVVDLTELSYAICHRVCEALEGDVGAVVLMGAYGSAPELKAGVGLPPGFGAEDLTTGVIAQVLTLDKTMDITDLAARPESGAGLGVRALLAAPLVMASGVVGAVLVGRRASDARFVTEDLHLLSSISLQVAAGIENARRRDEEKAREDHNRVYIGH